jgi:hypothetical protein
MTRPGDVDRLQGRRRPAAVAELAVIVVLDDPGIGRVGGGKQREAAGEAHGAADRLLVGGRDEGEADVRGAAHPFVHHQPLRVDRHRHEAGAGGGGEAVARADGAGVLEPDGVARVEQQVADELEAVLGAVDDEHLRLIAGDRPVGTKVRGDRPAERPVAAGVAVAHDDVAARPPVLGDVARPQGHREGVEGGHGGGEGARGRAAGARRTPPTAGAMTRDRRGSATGTRGSGGSPGGCGRCSARAWLT